MNYCYFRCCRLLVKAAVSAVMSLVCLATDQSNKRYGGDTRPRNLYKKHVQVDLYKKLDRLYGFLYKIFLVQVSCTEYSTALFHKKTCMHVTRMVSSDWSAAYRCHFFHFSSRRFAFASYFSVFRVLKLQQLLQQLPQHLYQLCLPYLL